MLASYVLSRTLVPVLSRMLMKNEHAGGGTRSKKPTRFQYIALSVNRWRDRVYDSFRDGYGRSLELVLNHRLFTLSIAGLLIAVSLALLFVIGMDFFPNVDAGIMKLHFRAPAGTRIEETEQMVVEIEQRIHGIIPAREIETINDMIGVPIFYNLAFVQTENIGGMDAEILISLKPGHRPTAYYRQKLRQELPRAFPGSRFYFEAADIVTQVLNFGLNAPLDVQVEGMDFNKSYGYSLKIRDAMREIPGTADVHINQILDYPSLQVDVDRTRAAELGMSERDVANNALVSLSSSVLVAPSFYLNPENNVNYTVAVQIPPDRINSLGRLSSVPLTPPEASNLLQPATALPPTDLPQAPVQTLANLSTIYHAASSENISHYTVQRVLDIEANVEGRDLGSVAAAIEKKIDALKPLPPGIQIHLRGQNEVMSQSFKSLALGLVLAVVLVYFLMVVLFQSWLDPFIIMMAVPGALVGILWMLALTGTTINVESLMGSIMAVGIATANSILLVSFANDIRVETGMPPSEAVVQAGKTRLRPVIMTALAMIIGMLPMAFAMGEAGEQNAPLGRAVIGGLLMATFVTLFIVPVIYTLMRTKPPSLHELDERFEEETKEGKNQG